MSTDNGQRFHLVSGPDLSVDNTTYRVVLARGTQFFRGELAEWLLGEIYKDHRISRLLPKSLTRDEHQELVTELTTAADHFSQAKKGEAIMLMIVAYQARQAPAKVGFTTISTSGVSKVDIPHILPYLAKRFPVGNWSVELLRVSLPKAKASISIECRAFAEALEQLVV